MESLPREQGVVCIRRRLLRLEIIVGLLKHCIAEGFIIVGGHYVLEEFQVSLESMEDFICELMTKL